MMMSDEQRARRAQNVARMMSGFSSLTDHFRCQPISEAQQQKLQQIKLGIQRYEEYLKLTTGMFEKPRLSADALNQALGHQLHVRGTKRQSTDGGFHLSQGEIDEFQRSGILGPYRVLSTAQARELHDYSRALEASDFGGTVLIGDHVAEILHATPLGVSTTVGCFRLSAMHLCNMYYDAAK